MLWCSQAISEDDGSTTAVYFQKPTPGNRMLRPGEHLRFRGIRSEHPIVKLHFLSLLLALFCGIASLPHVLIGYYTVKDNMSARKSTIVGIASIGFFYVLTLYLGLGAMTSGALDVTNSNMAASLLAKSVGEWMFAILSAIAFTTVLVGAIAIVLGILFQRMNVSYLVGWAFSVASSANLPSLVMLLFWKRTTQQGVIAAIVVGMISSLAWILISADTFTQVYALSAKGAIVPFSQPGIVTIPLGFLTLIVVSLLTKKK